MLSGQPRSEVIHFTAGFPDSNVAWVLKDPAGTILTSGNITPLTGAVSVAANISGSYNSLIGGEVIGYRDLSWSYLTGGATISDFIRYDIEALLPFGVSASGVREKLGVEDDAELPDSLIGLARSYLLFQEMVTSSLLSAAETGTALQRLKVREAIEAYAALALLPTMQIRVAKTETSGTNTFARQDVDWAALAAYLQSLVNAGATSVSGAATSAIGGGLFLLTTPTVDLFPG